MNWQTNQMSKSVHMLWKKPKHSKILYLPVNINTNLASCDKYNIHIVDYVES